MVPVIGLYRPGNRNFDPIHENMFFQVVQKTAVVWFFIRTSYGNPSRFWFGFAGVRRTAEFRRYQRRYAYQLSLFRASFSQ